MIKLYSELLMVRHFICHHLLFTLLDEFPVSHFLLKFGNFFLKLLTVRSEFLYFGKLKFVLLLVFTANSADSFMLFFELLLALGFVFELGLEAEKFAFELYLYSDRFLFNFE